MARSHAKRFRLRSGVALCSFVFCKAGLTVSRSRNLDSERALTGSCQSGSIHSWGACRPCTTRRCGEVASRRDGRRWESGASVCPCKSLHICAGLAADRPVCEQDEAEDAPTPSLQELGCTFSLQVLFCRVPTCHPFWVFQTPPIMRDTTLTHARAIL